MKPMIGLSVLLLMLVGSTSILHSATSEPFNSKIRRYADDMGIPAGALPVAQQSQATLESETEEIGPAVNDPNQAQVLIQNNEPDQDPGTINQAVSTLQTAEIPDQQQSLQPQIQQQLPQTQIQPQILEQQILQQQQIQQQQIQQQQQQQQQQIQQQQQQIQQQQQQQVQQQQLQQQVGVQESSARGLGSSLSTDQAIVDAGEVSQNQAPPPKIIENGSEVILPPNQQVFVASQQQQQQQQLQSLSAQSSVNETIVPSTARTYGFEGWTNCNGESSGKSGVCKNDVDCRQLKGHAEGSCMGGLGVCCVIALSCGDKSSENNTFFANPDFPESSWDARLCEVEIKKKSKSISQVLIEFEHFELALPDYEGECVTDIFQVKLASNRYSPYSNIRLCGMNTGQHLYLDVSQIDDPIVLSVATSGSNHARRWSIKIIQMDDKNYLQAPPGCLQYYTDTTGIVRSFNLGKNLRSLYYAICFRIDNGYSGIRFTDNYFGMSGGECSTPTSRLNMMAGPHRKKLIHHQSPTVQPTQYQPQQMTTTQYPGSQQQQGGYSHPYNPHHLVIAPPGHLPQLPPPSYGGGSSGYMSAPLVYNGAQLVSSPGRRFRRQVALDLDGQPMKRSFWSSSSSEPKKEETKPMKQEETTYSPTNNGGYNVYPTDYPQHMKFSHENKHHHQHMQQPSGYPTTYSPYGGASPSFYGSYYNQPPSNHYNQQQMGQYGSTPAMRYSPYGMTGQNYQQQSSVHEKFRTAGHQGGHMKHHHQHHHQQGLHHQQTGQPYMQYPSYGQNGGAYHKEIDRFGKKYEEIYYQHEKNHNKMKEDRYYENNYQHYENKNFKKDDKKNKKDKDRHHEVAFPELELLEPPHCEPRSCSNSDVITFPPSFGSTAEMCGNQFNRGRGPVVVSGSPLVVYVNSRGRNRGFGFDLYYEQVFAIPHQHY